MYRHLIKINFQLWRKHTSLYRLQITDFRLIINSRKRLNLPEAHVAIKLITKSVAKIRFDKTIQEVYTIAY